MATSAGVNFLLKLDGAGIQGESPVEGFKDYIEILGFQWGGADSGTFAYGEGGGGGAFTAHDFTFTMHVNKATPKVMEACANGTHLKSATLVCRKVGGKTWVQYLTVKMTDVLISSFDTSYTPQPTEAGNEDLRDLVPIDRIKLDFAKIVIEYKEQKADGSAGPAIEGGYDLKKLKSGGK